MNDWKAIDCHCRTLSIGRVSLFVHDDLNGNEDALIEQITISIPSAGKPTLIEAREFKNNLSNAIETAHTFFHNPSLMRNKRVY
jgi:hypothetical protein